MLHAWDKTTKCFLPTLTKHHLSTLKPQAADETAAENDDDNDDDGDDDDSDADEELNSG